MTRYSYGKINNKFYLIVEKCYNSFRIINDHGEIIRYGGKITEFKNESMHK